MPQKPILQQFLQRGRLLVSLKRLSMTLTYRTIPVSLYCQDAWSKEECECKEEKWQEIDMSPFLAAYDCSDRYYPEIKVLPEHKKALLLSEISGKVVRPAIEQAYFSANITLMAFCNANIEHYEHMDHKVYD